MTSREHTQHMPVFDGLPDRVGATPLVRLKRLFRPGGPRVFAKLESANPGGSAKDRPAALMLSEAIKSGELRAGDTVIESSSGNLGVALAQWCRWYGLHFICVVDPRTNASTIAIIEAFGGRVQQVPASDGPDFLTARRNRVAQLLQSTPRSWTPNQYTNHLNATAHAVGTMAEIGDALDDDVSAVFVATSTTGTLQGCCELIAERGMNARTFAVDAQGSVLFGGQPGQRMLSGFGASALPDLAEFAAPTQVIKVSDIESVQGCRALALSECILAGASGGAVVSAFTREYHLFGPSDNVVLILHDDGSRYLDTVYNDEWVRTHLHRQPVPAHGG